MDTVVEVKLYGQGEVPPEEALARALARAARLDSIFGDGTVLPGTPASSSPEFDRLITLSRKAKGLTRGMFDPTVGAVSRLWRFWADPAPPDPDSLVVALENVGLASYLEGKPGDWRFDVGGIAKGYAVDLAADLLAELGFSAALVNAGGDIRLLGERPGGEPWRIAIRHPRRREDLFGYLDLDEGAVATSGDYERCFFHRGVRYHHILDPRTGLPGRRSSSCTVVASSAALADALSTGLFLLGPHEGKRLVEDMDGVEAVFIYCGADSVKLTAGLAGRFGRYESD
jgi:thiamine biosynthesis lipoprotein